MHRFFVEDQKLISGKDIILPPEESHHINRVLRLSNGSTVVISDGRGCSHKASIIGQENGLVKVRLLESLDKLAEPPVSVTLIQGLPKGEKMDIIVQKAVELGVDTVIPVITERSVVSLSDEKARRKQKRWQKIARAAAAQSQRSRIPEVRPVAAFPDIIEKFREHELVFFLYEDEKDYGLKDFTGCGNINNITVIVGPEGGFTAEEADLACAAGAKSISLGPRILRTETAALTVLALILYAYGDLGGS